MRNNYNNNDRPLVWSDFRNIIVAFGIVGIFFLSAYNTEINSDERIAKQRALYSYTTVEQLEVEADRLQQTQPAGPIDATQFYTWLAEVRIARQAVEDLQDWGDIPIVPGLQKRLEVIDKNGCDNAMMSRFSMGYTDKIQREVIHPAMAAVTVPVERVPLLPRFGIAYAISGLVMLLLMAVKAREQEYSLLMELFTPTRLPLAVLFWPIAAWVYPYGSPLESLRYTLKLAACALAAVISFGASNGLLAQTSGSKKSSKTKPSADWTIQADARWGEVINGTGPNPQRQLRITVTSPNGWISENILGSNDRSWNAFISAGKRVIKNKYATVNVLPGFRVTKDKIRGSTDVSVAMNVQVFNTVNLPKGFPGFSAVNIATPVIQLERVVMGNPTNKRLNFTVVNQTFLKSKHWNLFPGYETVVSKSNNRPVTWNTGPLLEWKVPLKNGPRLGIGYLWNQAGTGVLRFRLTQSFAR